MFKIIILGALCTASSLYSASSLQQRFDEMDRQMQEMQQHMEQVFAEMAERTQATKLDAPDYSLQISENDDAVVLALAVPKTVTAEDISVEIENNILDVMIAADVETIELKVNGNVVNLSAAKKVTHEKKNAQGAVHMVNMGSTHMAQTQSLPARIDLQRMTPTADLTDGTLTITLAKKGAQKIAVTSTASTKIDEK